ncbi:MAG: 6-hydroxycyclohex-1-ene-1-carbonyl-CoA dehydrogenase [Polyangiaceae bacterium]|nr:6-hydroxycyclohex-1-ene-1-carbonyl-CoA dehydrogenase [Polyangiaceae bacterium]
MESFVLRSWQMTQPGAPLVRAEHSVSQGSLADGEVLVKVAACGVCHTDLGFYYGQVRPGRALPLTLGHEISGVVVAAGAASQNMVGRKVIVPAVIPCGACDLCWAGRGSICRSQLFPGSDVQGGFASHVVVPGRGLCPVDDRALAHSKLDLSDLAVIADAVSTPYQAVLRSGLIAGDTAVIVGAGGVGGFAAQIAAALGANVIAVDVDQARLDALAEHGVKFTVCSKDKDPGAVRKAVTEKVKGEGWNPYLWKIFETSGHPRGQETAFTLLTFGAHLSVVGYTLEKVNLRLSNLMAFDAAAQGNWGCLPSNYPGALNLVLEGKVKLTPFIEKRPMSQINETLNDLHEGRMRRRPVLIPDDEA